MAIRMMTSKEDFEKDPTNIEIVTNYSGHETTRVSHSYDCPHRKNRETGIDFKLFTDCDKTCRYHDALYMKTEFIGCVLDTGEENGRDDSDFYAVVWNEKEQKVHRITYATTRGWSYPNGAWIDATPEVIEKARAYYMKTKLYWFRQAAEAAAKKVEKGKTVKVVKGRKVKIGTIGEVFWMRQGGYGVTLGINLVDADGNKIERDDYDPKAKDERRFKNVAVFVAASNVEVVNHEQYMESEEDLERRVKYHVENNCFRGLSHYHVPGMVFM